MTAELITSLAILKVNFDRGGQDYVGNFVPLAAEVLRQSTGTSMSLAEAQSALRESFGLDIPQGPLRTILKRVASQGLATPRPNGQYEPIRERLALLDFAPLRDQALRQQRALVRRLVAFGQSQDKTISPEIAEALLTQYVQQRGPSLLASLIRSDDQPIERPVDTPNTMLLLVHSFVASIVHQDPEGFAALETLVKGSILFGAIFLPDLGGVTRRFRNLEIFFDTRLLLRALGLAGPVQEQPARELLDLCYELGASLLCFDHTVSEMVRVLTAVENSLRYRTRMRDQTSEIFEYLAGQGSRPSDVALLIERLPAMLRSLRLAIRERPAQSSRLAVDEPELALELRSATRRAYSDDAIGHDVDALTAVHRIRRGESKVVLEAAGAVIVTTNRLFKDVGNRFFERHYGTRGIPLIFDEEEFATISWLKKPTAAPALPVSLAIANSYAASSPPPEMWREYLAEIDRLQSAGDISEDEYYALRFSTSALADLSRRHSAAHDTVDAVTVLDILERVRKQIRVELRPEIERQVAGTAEAVSRGRIAKADSTVQSTTEGMRRLAETMANERRLRHDRFRGFAASTAHRLVFAMKAPIVILIIVFGLVGIAPILPVTVDLELPAWTHVLLVGGAVCLLAFGVSSAVAGTSVNSMFRGVEVSISERIERWLTVRFD